MKLFNRLVAWICWEQVDWSPRPTIYDNEGLLKGWKGCFWDLKAVDFLITYNFSLTMPRIIVCICIYYIYIYTHYIYTHIFPASVATSSISFLLNATGRFLVIISLTHPRKGFEKKQIGCNCFVDSSRDDPWLISLRPKVFVCSRRTCSFANRKDLWSLWEDWFEALASGVARQSLKIGWKHRVKFQVLSSEFCFIHVFVGYVPPRLVPSDPSDDCTLLIEV